MYLFDTLWAAATTVVSILSLNSPPNQGFDLDNTQIPLQVAPLGGSEASLQSHADSGPVFNVPGSNPFACDYSAMPGWEPCSTPQNRGCWLRRKSDGKEFNISTNYEDEMPQGIVRPTINLHLAKGWYAADGINFTEAQLFNNQYPGPWIQACWGDTIVVNVTNDVKNWNGTSVHWHGIRQLDSVEMDGVNGVTQCPIAPGDYFVYKFTVRQYGTAWYHSHYSVQYADGAVGPLTIHGPSSAPFDEVVDPPILVTDWGHKSAFVDAAVGSLSQKSILLNGKGDAKRFNPNYNYTPEVKPQPVQTWNFNSEPVQPKKYLLRIINTAFDTTFVVSIDNHQMQIVTADFVPIHPYTNTSVFVGIGQRHNVIVSAKPEGTPDPNGNYWIRTQIADCFGQQQGAQPIYSQNGIIRYNKSSTADPSTVQWPDIGLRCRDENYENLNPVVPWTIPKPPAPVNGPNGEFFGVGGIGGQKTYPLAVFSLDYRNKTERKFPIRVDYSNPLMLNLNHSGAWNESWRVVDEPWSNGGWVYMIMTGGTHPMHLHGHDFAILEQAYGKQFVDLKSANLKLDNPPRRDVVLMPSAGYVVIAFKADNPGPWIVHCHIAKHISWGLGFTIMERQADALRFWPDNSPVINETKRVCTKWNDWYKNTTHWAPNPNCTETNKDLCFQDDSGV